MRRSFKDAVGQEDVKDIIRRLSTFKIEDVKDIIRRLSTFKIEEETECCWDVFTIEILPRLSADHLQLLKTVCKNWLRIISSPYFVRLHLNLNNQSQIRILTFPCKKSVVMNMHSINCDDDVETKQIPFPPSIRKRGLYKILGSCDGLLCLLVNYPYKIVVYNPSTGKYLWVQPHRQYNRTIEQPSWFGRHPSSGEYVLVLWDYDYKIGVYKFNRRFTLDRIQTAPDIFFRPFCRCFENRGILLHGVLHWPAALSYYQDFRQSHPIICTYHLEHNKYSEISAPSTVQDKFKLGVNAEGCLFAIFNSANPEFAVEMWVMKEYGVKQFWAKHAKIVAPYHYHGLFPLGLFPNGDLILNVYRLGLIKYNFNNNKVLRLTNTEHVRSRFHAIVCVDSLVSPATVLEGK